MRSIFNGYLDSTKGLIKEFITWHLTIDMRSFIVPHIQVLFMIIWTSSKSCSKVTVIRLQPPCALKIRDGSSPPIVERTLCLLFGILSQEPQLELSSIHIQMVSSASIFPWIINTWSPLEMMNHKQFLFGIGPTKKKKALSFLFNSNTQSNSKINIGLNSIQRTPPSSLPMESTEFCS